VLSPSHCVSQFKAGNRSDASAWGDSNLPAADSLLVKVTTDQGFTGWGEAFGFRAVASAKLAIDQPIAPLCIGQDATRVGRAEEAEKGV
jgi:L-alanine-DL-glutamate epimerase-like enolase superfamily enzyme